MLDYRVCLKLLGDTAGRNELMLNNVNKCHYKLTFSNKIERTKFNGAFSKCTFTLSLPGEGMMRE